MEKTPAEKIREAAENAIEMETKEGKVRMPSISERIKAEQFAANQEASATGSPYGIRIARTVHTGQM
ncbi:MAG: hypothetical protein J6J31_14325 [Thermoguttaceae bacterium]|nr:hypothetical protein [Thermoguttaceae bacterium]